MYVWRKYLAGMAVVVLSLCPRLGVAQSDPPDVASVRRAMGAAREYLKASGEGQLPHALGEALVAAAQEAVDEVVSLSNIEREISARGSDEFKAEVRKHWLQQLKTMLLLPSEEQKAVGIAALVRKATSRGEAEEWLSSWLGVPMPRALSSTLAPRDGTQLWQPRGLGSQVLAQSRSADIYLVPERSEIIAESKGPGHANGVIDGGEWVHVRFVLGNDSTRPYFSSSVWLKSQSGCMWTDPEEEHVVSEIERNGGEGEFDAWILVSRECAHWTGVPFLLFLRDTHRTPSGSVSIGLEIRPVNLGVGRLQSALLDADVPGSSDGSESTQLSAGRSYELSSSLELGRLPNYAPRAVYGASDETLKLFDRFEQRRAEMVSSGNGLFLPGDDLDLRVIGKKELPMAQMLLRRASPWAEQKNGPLAWVAVDTEVLDLPPGWSPPKETAAATAPRQLTDEELVKLVLAHVRLESRPASPVLPGALKATEGYEVVFDREAFMAALQLITGRGEVVEAVATDVPVVRYVYRHFVPLRLAGVVAPAPPPPVVRPTPLPTPRPYVPPPPPPPEKPLVRVGLGVDFTRVPFEGLEADGDSLWLVGTSPRLTIGRDWCFGGGFDYATGTASNAYVSGAWGEDADVSQLMVWAGAGYIVGAGSIVEFQPTALLGGGRRKVADVSGGVFGLLLDAELRVHLGEYLALFGDLGFQVTSNGPENHGDDLLNGNQFRLGLGLRLRL